MAGQGCRLATINSASEQDFISNLLFNSSSVVNNVWIGATRNTEAGRPEEFIWVDGKIVSTYANWVPGSPSATIGRNCVQLQSGWTMAADTPGLWKDVNCEAGNWAVCESFQVWSPYETQLAIIELRRALNELRDNPGTNFYSSVSCDSNHLCVSCSGLKLFYHLQETHRYKKLFPPI